MAYHSKNGREFLGLRCAKGTGKQIVYDAVQGRRVLLNIVDQSTEDSIIEAALQDGITKSNAFYGVMSALEERSIAVDLEVSPPTF
ncbi:MAG: hypothetical protein ABF254_00735 [Octadecabacter sp.]